MPPRFPLFFLSYQQIYAHSDTSSSLKYINKMSKLKKHSVLSSLSFTKNIYWSKESKNTKLLLEMSHLILNSLLKVSLERFPQLLSESFCTRGHILHSFPWNHSRTEVSCWICKNLTLPMNQNTFKFDTSVFAKFYWREWLEMPRI